MSYIPKDYPEKVYAGVYGKIIGVRHGAPIEGWTREQIAAVYGTVTDYLVDYREFAADDDINGTFLGIRALDDYTCSRDLSEKEIGLTLLNYAPYEHGYFWWGGYGVSTEHTAYLNLRNGILPPRSGSIEQNGKAIAEQIGGQIFIDAWGLIAPCNPQLAAEFAKKAASVTHDGNSVYGGMFVAACISAAFEEDSIDSILKAGLSVIPADCEYAKVAGDVRSFYERHPESWEKAFEFVKENYGYDRYPGVCHVIPNAAVIVLSLLYGRGDFSRSINIANMCGWDTDCNVANVGTILGVKCGIDGIDRKWKEPIHDFVVFSGVMGSGNITDIPGIADGIVRAGYLLAGVTPAGRWSDSLKESLRCHFEYPGSTHAFRFQKAAQQEWVLGNTEECAHSGAHSLKISVKNYRPGDELSVYLKTYYSPSDFHDSRYDPAFSPILYPGQTIKASVMLPSNAENGAQGFLYVKDRNSGGIWKSDAVTLKKGVWEDLEFRVPRIESACLERAGIAFIPTSAGGTGTLLAYLDDFEISGAPDYSLDFAREKTEVWPGTHREVSQFTYLKGVWRLEEGQLSGSCADFGEAYTGSEKWADYEFDCTVVPQLGEYHSVNFRVQGAVRSYAAGLAPDGKLALYKNQNGYKILCQTDFLWELKKEYPLTIKVCGNRIQVACGNAQLNYQDTDKPYLAGAVGMSVRKGSHCHYKDFSLK